MGETPKSSPASAACGRTDFALRDSHVENERLKKTLNEREAELIKAKEGPQQGTAASLDQRMAINPVRPECSRPCNRARCGSVVRHCCPRQGQRQEDNEVRTGWLLRKAW